MMREEHGNLLDADAVALVNTVNTVGVMGKGIALQFKRAFPDNYKAYKRACDVGDVELGHMFIWDAGALAPDGPRYVINFPTKRHWRSKSTLADIQAGLEDLVRQIKDLSITTVAVPPLGCGHGGLRWAEVRPLIVAAFEQPVRTAGPFRVAARRLVIRASCELRPAQRRNARDRRSLLQRPVSTVICHRNGCVAGRGGRVAKRCRRWGSWSPSTTGPTTSTNVSPHISKAMICGLFNRSAVVTLVERISRYTVLADLPIPITVLVS